MNSIIAHLKRILSPTRDFSSKEYWNKRYQSGGNSGPGSFGHLAEFKSTTINQFIKGHQIASVIEFGCGDGNQLSLAEYPQYTGYDISTTAIDSCRNLFQSDGTKSFHLTKDYNNQKADLILSLDVIFHLTEDAIFDNYMRLLFSASSRYVIIYSSNQNKQTESNAPHVRHRNFSKWIEDELPSGSWTLKQIIPNPYPYNGDFKTTSFADFYIYMKS